MPQQVIITNPIEFEEKKKRIIAGGVGKLHVLSDFDKTLTHAYVNGEKTPSLIGILREGGYLSDEYTNAARALSEKYSPLENDVSIPLDERKKNMQEWWEKHFELLLSAQLPKSVIATAVCSPKICLRGKAGEVLRITSENNIPVVIMSASGMGGEGISMYLENHKQRFKNIQIISNYFIWNDANIAVDIGKPIIHSLNKGENVLKNFPEIHAKIKDRKNVILLGDSLGDLGMIEGFEYAEMITVGFLNDNIEKNMSAYQAFDVVIAGDGDMSFVEDLLKDIIS